MIGEILTVILTFKTTIQIVKVETILTFKRAIQSGKQTV